MRIFFMILLSLTLTLGLQAEKKKRRYKPRYKKGKLVKKNKMRVKTSITYGYYNGEGETFHNFNIAGAAPYKTLPVFPSFAPGGDAFTFFDPQLSGFEFDYGYNSDLQLSASLSVFGMISGDASRKQILGPLKVGALYQLFRQPFDIILNPYIEVPFLQINTKGENSHFDHPFGLGLAASMESKYRGNVNWGIWANFGINFEREKDNVKYGEGTYVNFAGFLSYKIKRGSFTKGYIIYDSNNLSTKSIDLGDGSVSFKVSYEMNWDRVSNMSFGLWYRIGMSKKNPINEVTNLGFSFAYTRDL